MPNPVSLEEINALIQELKVKDQISDGYHTFEELYAHRIMLFVALCNTYSQLEYHPSQKRVWKSRAHADGIMFAGYFIAGIGDVPGDILTYHLPLVFWDMIHVKEIPRAPEWDWHTCADVLERLSKL